MSILVVDGPAEVVSLDRAKAHLRVDHGDEDELIGGLARAAERHLSGPEGWLGRSIGLQTLTLRTIAFSLCARLPCGPVAEVTEVAYFDDVDGRVLVGADIYQLVDEGSVVARIELRAGRSWPFQFAPTTRVEISYVAGYPAGKAPDPLVQAMLLLIGHWYENREAAAIGQAASPLPFAVEALCATYRIWS